MLTVAGECAGANHRAGIYGHDVEQSAAYQVRSECPGCLRADDVALCAGRVEWIQHTEPTMECPRCGYVGAWPEFWRMLAPLGIAEQSNPEPEAPSTGDLLSAFEDHLESRRRAAGTIRERLRVVCALAEDHDVRTVTPEQLDAWIVARARAAEWMPATINGAIKSLRVFFAWADRFGVIRPNPATLLDLVPNPHRAARIVNDDEYAEAVRTASPQLRAMLMLGRLAGLRLSEITTLHTDDDRGEWLVIIGKGSRQRRLYVVPELRAALDAIRPASGGYYFPGATGGHLHPQSVHKIIKRETGFNPHALRRAAGTAVYAATKDIRATQAFLGHSQPTTTAIDAHVMDDDLQRAALAGSQPR